MSKRKVVRVNHFDGNQFSRIFIYDEISVVTTINSHVEPPKILNSAFTFSLHNAVQPHQTWRSEHYGRPRASQFPGLKGGSHEEEGHV